MNDEYHAQLASGELPAHAAAARDALLDIVVRLANGEPPESVGRQVIQLGMMMERRT